jgi:hypothetical protein
VGLCDFDYYKRNFVGFYVFKDYRNSVSMGGFWSNLVGFFFFFFWFDCVQSKGMNLENLGAFG